MKTALSSTLFVVAALVSFAVPVVGNLVQRWQPGTPMFVSEEEAAQVYGGTCQDQTNNFYMAATCKSLFHKRGVHAEMPWKPRSFRGLWNRL